MKTIDLFAAVGGLLVLAKLLSGLARKAGVPSVMSELVIGIIAGNVGISSPLNPFSALRGSEIAQSLSELGILLLLFMVGLETEVDSVRKAGRVSLKVALVGVICPALLAIAALPVAFDIGSARLAFMAAALTATSVGITVRTLQDLGLLRSPSGQVILGAAVIDDILGILILTAVSAFVTQGRIEGLGIGLLLLKTALFLAALGISRVFVFPRLFQRLRPLETQGMVTVLAVGLALLSAWTAERIGLAGILGAFGMGIALDSVHFQGYRATESIRLEEMIRPLSDFFSPLFFVLTGMGVDLASLAHPSSLGLAGALIACAILGKLACGLVARGEPGVDRPLVGLGMLPRGEVGIVFAALGLSLKVLTQADYSATIVMVAVTTLLAPGLLSIRARQLEPANP